MIRNVLPVLGLLVLTPAANAQIVRYREIFPNTSGANVSLGSAGWNANATSTGVSIDGNPALLGISSNLGKSTPGQSAPVNSNPLATTDNGFAFSSAGSITQVPGFVGTQTLFWSGETPLGVTASQLTEISWYMGNEFTAARHPARAAIQVGSNWYVSDQVFSNVGPNGGVNAQTGITGANFSTFAELMTLGVTPGTQWRDLTFVPGVSLALGAGTTPTSGLAGSVNAYGLFYDFRSNSGQPAGNLRFDSYTITAVVPAQVIPEPGTLALACMGLLPLTGAALRRRRAA